MSALFNRCFGQGGPAGKQSTEVSTGAPAVPSRVHGISIIIYIVTSVLLIMVWLTVTMIRERALKQDTPGVFRRRHRSSNSCTEVSWLYRQSRKNDVHPCENFYQHVCTGSTPRHPSYGTLTMMLLNISKEIIKRSLAIKSSRTDQTGFQKASLFLQLCNQRKKDYAYNIDALQEFVVKNYTGQSATNSRSTQCACSRAASCTTICPVFTEFAHTTTTSGKEVVCYG